MRTQVDQPQVFGRGAEIDELGRALGRRQRATPVVHRDSDAALGRLERYFDAAGRVAGIRTLGHEPHRFVERSDQPRALRVREPRSTGELPPERAHERQQTLIAGDGQTRMHRHEAASTLPQSAPASNTSAAVWASRPAVARGGARVAVLHGEADADRLDVKGAPPAASSSTSTTTTTSSRSPEDRGSTGRHNASRRGVRASAGGGRPRPATPAATSRGSARGSAARGRRR